MSNNIIPFHPAPGLGIMLPGWWTVPQNPIVPQQTMYAPRMGELLPASFVVPQNPIVRTTALGVNATTGIGCMSCEAERAAGMGSLGFFDSYNPVEWNWTEWAVVGGGVLFLLLMMRPGKSAYQAGMTQAKQDYRKAVERVKSKYPRVGGRIRRAAKAAAGELS